MHRRKARRAPLPALPPPLLCATCGRAEVAHVVYRDYPLPLCPWTTTRGISFWSAPDAEKPGGPMT